MREAIGKLWRAAGGVLFPDRPGIAIRPGAFTPLPTAVADMEGWLAYVPGVGNYSCQKIAGSYVWSLIGAAAAAPGGAGGDTQVIFNDGGVLAGDAGLTYNKTTNALTEAGALMVDGSADVVQLTVQGNATQTALLAVFENSSGTDQVTIAGNGAVVINEAGNDADTRIEGDTDINLVFVDASTDRVGVGTNAPGTKLHVSGGIQSDHATAGVGYRTGAGGTITQLTSKATSVTLGTNCGQITTHNALMATGAVVAFLVLGAPCVATDVIVANHVSGGTLGNYLIAPQAGAGAWSMNIRNLTAGNQSDALVINFAILKGVTS